MSHNGSDAPIDWVVNGEGKKLFWQHPTEVLGPGIAAMVLVAIVVLPLLARGKDPTIPVIMLILFSGVLVPNLPGMLVNVAWGVIWIGGAVAIYLLINQFQ